MRLPELLVPDIAPVAVEAGAVLRRRRVTTGITLVVGTGLLAATLRMPQGSGWFSVLGLLVAATWMIGALLSGPIPIWPQQPAPWRKVAFPSVATGVVTFLGFVVGYLAVQHVSVLSSALDSVLRTADAGPLALVLAVALVNAIAEEFFFRGALHAAAETHRPALVSTAIYVAVTAATGNGALVAAAIVMGTVFSLERLSTRSVLAPIVTHITWSTLMLLALPR